MQKIWVAAAILNLIVALIHTIIGHFELIIPFINTDFEVFLKAVLHSCWHMVTVILFSTSIIFLIIGLKPKKYASAQISIILGVLYLSFSFVFFMASIWYGLFLSQGVLLLLIGILAIFGSRCIRYDSAKKAELGIQFKMKRI